MNLTRTFLSIVTCTGLVACLLTTTAAAQAAPDTDPIGLFGPIHRAAAEVMPAGFCFSTETNCDTACDSACDPGCDQPSCDAIGGGCWQPKCDCCKCRRFLLGDLAGFRSCAADHGITVQSSLTQFYQGVASGGAEQRFRYGAKLDLFAELNTEKMGLWKGGSMLIHAANWNFGQNSVADAAFLAPVNANLLYPKGEPSFAVTSLWYQQELGDSGYALLAGRYDLLDVWALFYPEYGRGIDGFMNVSSFVPFNIVTIGLPPISNLAGIVKAGDQGIEAAFLVLETANHPTNIGLNFPNGVTILPTLRKYTKFGGLRGTHTLAAWYATGDFTSFDVDGWIEYPPGLGTPPKRSGSWSATYLAEQRLWQDRCNDKRYTNFFGYIDWSDGDVNPFDFTGGCSLEAFGLFSSRPNDRMGIAGFYNRPGDLSDLLSVVTPTGDVYGGEFYYNAEINPWFHLSFDLQAVRPGFRSRDTAVVVGTRAKIDF
jgi:porin